MLHLMPRHTPPLPMLLDALQATPETAAHALGVSARTVYRWAADGDAPRPAALALWWLTPWGWSVLDSEVGHRMATAAAQVDALRAELTQERSQAARLLRMGYGGGSANLPIYRQAGR